ncbi:hypothetical protein ACIBSW_40365 [Actinoplanes sp. NPDC049668]|uniref:hypothetical protein n=1 Tax=unclassified Actinoplanes TaxID=2626549 RepID=UPI0033B3D871
MSDRPASTPPLVTVLAILLYLAGGLVIAYALIGLGRSVGGVTGLFPVWGQALYGAFYVALARALQLGWRWARLVLLTLCWIGLALAAWYTLADGPQAALAQAASPAIYLVLSTRASVRDWFAPSVPPAVEDSDGPR